MKHTQDFGVDPVSVPRARAFVAEALAAFPADVIERAQLGVSELASNALRHSDNGFIVSIIIDETQVQIEVTDTGDGKPEKRSPGPLDQTGRGLLIVEAVSDRWDVVPLPVGKTVAFVISLLPEASGI